MKKILFIFIFLFGCMRVSAQFKVSDYQTKVYFYTADSVKTSLEEINANVKVKRRFVAAWPVYEFDGTSAPYTLGITYIYVELSPVLSQSIRNFKFVNLEVKDGKRYPAEFKFDLGEAGSSDDQIISLKYEKVGDNTYRFSTFALPDGHYGLFYNYANNMPIKIWDFDIKKYVI